MLVSFKRTRSTVTAKFPRFTRSPLFDSSRELSQVQNDSEKHKNMTLNGLSTTREILARYTLEDIGKTLSVSIQMESCHPLKPIRISCEFNVMREVLIVIPLAAG